MKIAHVVLSRLPATTYGGIERVVWWLAKDLASRGHAVVLLADAGSSSPFAEVRVRDPRRPIESQIPDDVDIVHFHCPYAGDLQKPFLVTGHSNWSSPLPRNTVFVSADQARRYGSRAFVHNGIDPEDYGRPELSGSRTYLHFLGKAAWRAKNVRGAIRVARAAGVRLEVIGGRRLNFNMGFRFTLDPRIRFAGMVGGERKNRLLNGSRGLIFPILWHEPFGLAVIESLYFGCPVIGTPFGALPEIVSDDVGVLSDRFEDLVDAVRRVDEFSRARCHEWVLERFSARRMTEEYLALYGRVMSGEALNPREPRALPVAAPKLILESRGRRGSSRRGPPWRPRKTLDSNTSTRKHIIR